MSAPELFIHNIGSGSEIHIRNIIGITHGKFCIKESLSIAEFIIVKSDGGRYIGKNIVLSIGIPFEMRAVQVLIRTPGLVSTESLSI